MATKRNVVKMNHVNNYNVGFVIFFIIIIYVLFNIFSYFTQTHISEYEVQKGTIATNYVYKGLILRDENIVYANQSGNINYYIKNASKASVRDVICSVDTDGSIFKQIQNTAGSGSGLSDDGLNDISVKLSEFMSTYDSTYFGQVYSLHQDLNSELLQNLNQSSYNSIIDQVDLAVSNNTFFPIKPEVPALISYQIDGYESLNIDNFTADDLIANYSKTNLDTNTSVKTGDPLFKTISSEDWNIVIGISNDMAERLNEDDVIKIRFCKDNYTTTASCSMMKKKGSYFLNLNLSSAMMRYVNDRFVDIELVLNEQNGLKIPNSSIVKKEFYTIPKEYFLQGGDSSDYGVMVEQIDKKKKKTNVVFVQPTIYFENDKYYYVDSEFLTAGDYIQKPGSVEKYVVGTDVDSLEGVYNINKGYAVFKQINVISQNDEYSIVETKTAYGIALYDHIALDGSKVKENQLVTKK